MQILTSWSRAPSKRRFRSFVKILFWMKIPCSGEAFVTGRTAAALATTQRAGNTSACFVNKLETNCSQFIPLYLLCTLILISVVLHGEDALKIALGKNVRSVQLASKSTKLRPGTQKTFGRKNTERKV